MDARLQRVFGEYIRTPDGGELLTADGRPLVSSSPALEMAKRLLDASASQNADEIIKLVKPYCRPFNIAAARQMLREMGAENDSGGSDTSKGGNMPSAGGYQQRSAG